jgi:hypothetical protein
MRCDFIITRTKYSLLLLLKWLHTKQVRVITRRSEPSLPSQTHLHTGNRKTFDHCHFTFICRELVGKMRHPHSIMGWVLAVGSEQGVCVPKVAGIEPQRGSIDVSFWLAVHGVSTARGRGTWAPVVVDNLLPVGLGRRLQILNFFMHKNINYYKQM